MGNLNTHLKYLLVIIFSNISIAIYWLTRTRNNDHVLQAQAWSTAPSGPIVIPSSAGGCSNSVADDRVLDAAVASFLSDAVLVVLSDKLLTSGKVITLNCSYKRCHIAFIWSQFAVICAPVMPVWYWKHPCWLATQSSLQLSWVT